MQYDTYLISYDCANKLYHNSENSGFTDTRLKDKYYDGSWSIIIFIQARGIIQSSYDKILCNKLYHNSENRGFTDTRLKDKYYDGSWSIIIFIQARGIIQSSYDKILCNKLYHNSENRGFTDPRSKDEYVLFNHHMTEYYATTYSI